MRGQRERAEAGRPGARAREEPREAKAIGEASARSRPCGGDGAVDPQLLPEKLLFLSNGELAASTRLEPRVDVVPPSRNDFLVFSLFFIINFCVMSSKS
jgi:hypothetical protein